MNKEERLQKALDSLHNHLSSLSEDEKEELIDRYQEKIKKHKPCILHSFDMQGLCFKCGFIDTILMKKFVDENPDN